MIMIDMKQIPSLRAICRDFMQYYLLISDSFYNCFFKSSVSLNTLYKRWIMNVVFKPLSVVFPCSCTVYSVLPNSPNPGFNTTN